MTRIKVYDLNLLGLFGVCGVLTMAYVMQWTLNELPCPLCMLQRVAFTAVAFGLVLNVRYGIRASHQGIVILSALFGMAVSGRQMLLHITPGSGSYGSPVLGLHYYSWAFVLFTLIVVGTAGLLLIQSEEPPTHSKVRAWLARVAVYAAIALTFGNALTNFAQCGPFACPDNPTSYWLSGLL